MKTYYANFIANNSESLVDSITDTNLRRITKEIRTIANDCRYPGHTCKWYVLDEDGRYVAAGYTDRNGRESRTENE